MIDQSRLHDIFDDCLFRPEELPPESGCAPEGALSIRGIAHTYGLHPERLESHRAEVAKMLVQLPDQFMASKGGGRSFLNACQTGDGQQWTGFHAAVEQLFALGIGLGMAAYLLPREMWPALPGGMPYLVIDDAKVAKAIATSAEMIP
jgi:hypothetical protein